MERTRIFLVEDQPALLKNLVKALGTFPELEIVGTAQEGERALEELLPLAPDVVLLDLELPGIDGIEVTRRLRRRNRGIEVLILTSFDDEQKVFEAIREGAAGYLVKRVGPEKIRSAIAEVMAGGTVIEARIARRFWHLFDAAKPGPADRAAAAPAVDPWGLTELERELLRMVAKGLSNAEVGQVMAIERRTVRTHLGHIYRKLGVSSHVEAVVAAIRAGLVEL